MTYSERIKELRKSKGLSQAEMGSQIGFSKATVGMWEAGNRRPTIEALEKMSNLFDRSVDYILGSSDDPTPKFMDSDYLAASGIGEEYRELFAKFLLLDDYAKDVATEVICRGFKRCVETKTLYSEFENDFEVRVYFKPDVAAAAKVAPHNPVLDRSDASEDFEVLDDDEN